MIHVIEGVSTHSKSTALKLYRTGILIKKKIMKFQKVIWMVNYGGKGGIDFNHRCLSYRCTSEKIVQIDQGAHRKLVGLGVLKYQSSRYLDSIGSTYNQSTWSKSHRDSPCLSLYSLHPSGKRLKFDMFLGVLSAEFWLFNPINPLTAPKKQLFRKFFLFSKFVLPWLKFGMWIQ